jgi:SMC interacting uncharacterized protein involved in chromosome segregation
LGGQLEVSEQRLVQLGKHISRGSEDETKRRRKTKEEINPWEHQIEDDNISSSTKIVG